MSNTAHSALSRPQPLASDMRRSGLSTHPVTRSAFAYFLAETKLHPDAGPDDVARSLWPKDISTPRLITRGALDPQSVGDHVSLVQASVGAFFSALPQSAAARLIEAGLPVDMAGSSAVSLPNRANSPPAAPWVGEGDPIPVRNGATGAVALGPVQKAALLMTCSRELAKRSNAEEIFRTLLLEEAALTIDAAIFNTAAATADSPAGLLYGATAITGYSGGDDVAMMTDLRALSSAVAAAGGSGTLALIVSPARLHKLQLAMPLLSWPVWASRAVPDSRVIALDPTAFAVGFGNMIDMDASDAATLHMSDDPDPIRDGTTADPTRSLFQTNSIAFRMMIWMAFRMRGTGLIQYLDGATW